VSRSQGREGVSGCELVEKAIDESACGHAVAIGISAGAALAQSRAAMPKGDGAPPIRFRARLICDSFPAGYQLQSRT